MDQVPRKQYSNIMYNYDLDFAGIGRKSQITSPLTTVVQVEISSPNRNIQCVKEQLTLDQAPVFHAGHALRIHGLIISGFRVWLQKIDLILADPRPSTQYTERC